MLPLDLSNQVAIVTGGGVGIGQFISLELAKAGADVVVASRKPANLAEVAEEIKSLGRRSLAVATDVTIPEQVDNLVQQTVDKLGGIDILVNNAGFSYFGPPEEIKVEEWDAVIDVNLKGPFLCCRSVGRVMIEQKRGGKIINIASRAGLVDSPNAVHYGAAKAGLINLTRSLALAWAKYKIYVNCIAPGLIKTEGMVTALQMTPKIEQEMAKKLPVERLGRPEDIAFMAVFLASRASDFITGETVAVCGGPACFVSR
jgi:NAD(P)-dependent dehydrogenase (short-subunit alcohol dehydrogenase family)